MPGCETFTSLSVQDDPTAAFATGLNLKASIDELAVYDHALSADRVLAHFMAGS
jgi:hypothetical protein